MAKNVGINFGEFLYGIFSVIFGYPTIEKILAGEILSQATGGLRIILAILFGLIFLFGYIALIDFICRRFNTTFADELNDLTDYLRKKFGENEK